MNFVTWNFALLDLRPVNIEKQIVCDSFACLSRIFVCCLSIIFVYLFSNILTVLYSVAAFIFMDKDS